MFSFEMERKIWIKHFCFWSHMLGLITKISYHNINHCATVSFLKANKWRNNKPPHIHWRLHWYVISFKRAWRNTEHSQCTPLGIQCSAYQNACLLLKKKQYYVFIMTQPAGSLDVLSTEWICCLYNRSIGCRLNFLSLSFNVSTKSWQRQM